MNIKINIKDCDCGPTVITKKQISEVQFKKKNMLYAPPTKGQTTLKNSAKRNPQNTINLQSRKNQPSKYVPSQQEEHKFLNQMSHISKNQITTDMIQNTNTILQRQNQILEQNQRTIHHLVTNPQNVSISRQDYSKDSELKRVYEESADMIARQVREIKKMRDEIIDYGQNLKRTASEGKPSNVSRGQQHIGEMNANLRNLVEMSKNHIDGLENLEGIKNLQNFNIQAYTQAINTLKKQIVQYQKQSQNIERQLKLRAAKLQKLQISPNFDEQLLQPYQQHLRKKADSINLHTIKERVYEKLGVFDYGKFETDVSTITNQIKNQMNDFYITCKQFRIQIPDIKIDKKELKQLDLNLPSVLDQYKASRGIAFTQKAQFKDQKKAPQTKKSPPQFLNSRQKPNQSKNMTKKTSPKAADYGEIYTKPVDLSKNTKLTRTDQQKPKTVLETSQQKQRKQVHRNVKKIKQANPDDDFQKYLQNRAKQQLASIYEQKRKKLQQMEKELYNACKEQPQYELTLNVKNKVSSPKKIISKHQTRRQEEEQYEQDFEEQEQQPKSPQKENKPKRSEQNKQAQQIKNIGTEVLRQKLKNLFTKNPNLNEQAHQNRLLQPQNTQVQAGQLTSMAEGFINMINNTLTQVNTQLSQSIQKKMESRSYSQERGPQINRRSANQITIPKLQQFRAPPVFNMQMVYEPMQKVEQRKVERKIVAKDYNYLRVDDENNELQISSISNQE